MGLILRAKTIDLRETRPLTFTREKNAVENRREAEEQKIFLHSLPRRLVFELTNACNLRCIMCGRSAVKFTPTYFDLSWLDHFEPIADRVEEVTLMGWGEPTIHPDFIDFLKWAHKHGLRKYFCTNGMTLGDLVVPIFETEVDIIAVSIDGANAEVNNRIRRGSDFHKVIRNIERIATRRVDLPYMNFVFTAMRSNIKQLPDVVRLASDVGLDEVKVVYLTVFDRMLEHESLYDCKDVVSECFAKAEDIADRYGIALKLPYIQGEDPAGDQYHRMCYTAWRDFFIGSDGYIRPCMSSAIKLFHIDDYSSFEEMWNSEQYMSHRSKVNSDAMDDCCVYCYQSSFANWNRMESWFQLGKQFAPDWTQRVSEKRIN